MVPTQEVKAKNIFHFDINLRALVMTKFFRNKLSSLYKRIAMRSPGFRKYRVLIKLDRWLLPAVLMLFLLVGLTGFSVLKLWRTTPENFKPVVKVSWLDYLQSWALQRRANQDLAANNPEAASGALAAAIGNDPGNPHLFRLQLDVIQQMPPSLSSGKECALYGSWLMHLTRTNRADLERFVQTMEHCRHYAEITYSLESKFESSSAPIQASYLRALFEQGNYSQFQEIWARRSEGLQAEPLMPLYAKAIEVIDKTAKPTDLEELKANYKSIKSDPAFADQAGHVVVRTFAAIGRLPETRQVLRELINRRSANVSDHLAYWLLLLRQGQTESIQYEPGEVGQPANVVEALLLANLLRSIGEKEASRLIAESALTVYGGQSYQIWLDYGDMLTSDQSWQELHNLARRAQNHVNSTELPAMAQFWEALIAWKMDRPERAAEAFGQLADLPPESEQLRFQMANALLALGQAESADQLVTGMRGDSSSVRLYWLRRVNESLSSKNLSALHGVALSAFESSPSDLVHISNLASAILLARKEPQTALELTQQLMAAKADFLPYQLNHIHALIQAKQLTEAEQWLARLAEVEKAAPIEADYEFAQFELAVAKGARDEIVSRFGQVKTDSLFPETIRWVQEAVAPFLGRPE